MYSFVDDLIDSLINWLIIHWLINWFIDLLINSLIDLLIHWSIHWLINSLIYSLIDWFIDCTPGCEVVPDVNIQQCRYGIKLSVPSTDGMSDLWLRCENESQYAQVRITPPPPLFWFHFGSGSLISPSPRKLEASVWWVQMLVVPGCHMLQPTLHGAKPLIKTTAKSFNLPLSHPSSQICLPLCFFAPLKFFSLSYGKIITPSSLHIFLEILVIIF